MRNAGKRGAIECPRRSSRLSEGGARPVFDYRIEYEGKIAPERVLRGQRSSVQRVMHVEADSPPLTANRIYCGDNLGLLRTLCDNASLCGKITLAYIDPPFATGSSLESRDAEHAYDDLFSGAKYLESLRQRIILLRELLAPSGSLYIHLDGKKACPMKVILDEIFGASNFRNWITRKKSNCRTTRAGNTGISQTTSSSTRRRRSTPGIDPTSRGLSSRLPKSTATSSGRPAGDS